ncbi:peptidoglycan -binding protein [Acidisoma sp. C75]
MPGYHRRRQHNGLDAWPGYVDALSTLLMVTIFVLLVFVLAQGLLSVTLSGKDRALAKLNSEIAQLTDMLSLEKGRANNLENNVASLAHDLGQATAKRDRLAADLTAAQKRVAQDSATITSLTAARDELNAKLADALLQAQSATARLNAMQGQLGQQMTAAASAQSTLTGLQTSLAEAEKQHAADQASLTAAEAAAARATAGEQAAAAQVASLQGQLASLQSRAQTAEAGLAQAQSQLANAQAVAASGTAALSAQKQLTDQAEAQITLLNQQMAALRQQLQAITAALDLQVKQGRDKDAEIADLGRKLNLALAAKVQKLERYRSDFFGELRDVLKNQPNIKVVGDRFVFESDVLFGSGSADLTTLGQQQINDISVVMKKIIPEIPANLPWVLRVDGYADSQPVIGGPYQNNWLLSAARAISVVQLLILDGIPADHLAAGAFGDTRPLDPAHTPAAYAKNRRIEFRLTDH